jgi:hypothetical protein
MTSLDAKPETILILPSGPTGTATSFEMAWLA